MTFRSFSKELEALADVWSTSATTSDSWTPTGRKWATNSKPFEVQNQNNVRGVAKPGEIINDRCLRAAHEKIVSDLGFVLRLPIPPVTLWDRGENFVGDRRCAVSAWAFPKAVEWQHIATQLTAQQIEIAKRGAGAMRAFDTWLAASDRKNDHVLVHDDGDAMKLELAHIDYAFALSYEWTGVCAPQPDPRPAFPTGIDFDRSACLEMAALIEKIEESRIVEIVNRIPQGYFPDGVREVIIKQLLGRRGTLRTWLAL